VVPPHTPLLHRHPARYQYRRSNSTLSSNTGPNWESPRYTQVLQPRIKHPTPHSKAHAIAPLKHSNTQDAAPRRPLSGPQPLEPIRTPHCRTSTPTTTAAAAAATATTPAATAERTTPRLRRWQSSAQPQPIRTQPERLPVKYRRHRRRIRRRTGSSCGHWRGCWRHGTRWTGGAHAVCSWRAITRERCTGAGRCERTGQPADTGSLAEQPTFRDGCVTVTHRPVPVHQHGQYMSSPCSPCSC
jgi:hypothetical protein